MSTSAALINAFIIDVKMGKKFPPVTHLDFIEAGIYAQELPPLVQLLKSGLCPKGLHLSFYSNEVCEESLQKLCEALESGNCPPDLTISISTQCPRGRPERYKRCLTSKDVVALTKALMSPHCPEGFTLELTGVLSDPSQVKPFADVLAKGLAPKRFSLKLGPNFGMYPKGADVAAEIMANALATGNCPEDFSLDMSAIGVTEVGARLIINALDKVKRGTTIDLRDNLLGPIGSDVANLLRSGNAPKGLTLKFRLALEEAALIWDAVLSDQCPEDLRLEFQNNGNTEILASNLVRVLRSQQCPKGFSASIGRISQDGVNPIAELLKSGSCPPGQEFAFQHSPGDIWTLTDALRFGRSPHDLTLDLDVQFPREWMCIIIALQSGKCPAGFHLRLSGSLKLTSDHIKELEAILLSGCCPPRFQLEAPCEFSRDSIRLQEILLANNNRHYQAVSSLFALQCVTAHRSDLTLLHRDVRGKIAKMLLPVWWDMNPRENFGRIYPNMTMATLKPEPDVLGPRRQLLTTMWESESLSRIRFHKKRAAALLSAFGHLLPEECLQLIENQLGCYQPETVARVPLPNGLTEFERAHLEPRFKRISRRPPAVGGYHHALIALKAALEKMGVTEIPTLRK